MAITDEIPKSRLTLTYRTTVRGQSEEVQLPFRLVVMGDLSGGSSRDRQVDLDRRTFRRLDGKNLTDERIKTSGYTYLSVNPTTGVLVTPLVSALGKEGVLSAFYANPRQVFVTASINF